METLIKAILVIWFYLLLKRSMLLCLVYISILLGEGLSLKKETIPVYNFRPTLSTRSLSVVPTPVKCKKPLLINLHDSQKLFLLSCVLRFSKVMCVFSVSRCIADNFSAKTKSLMKLPSVSFSLSLYSSLLQQFYCTATVRSPTSLLPKIRNR